MPTVRFWPAKGNGWLGINLKLDPAVLIKNTASWPAVLCTMPWRRGKGIGLLRNAPFAIIWNNISPFLQSRSDSRPLANEFSHYLHIWGFMRARCGVFYEQTLPFPGRLSFLQLRACKSGSVLQFDIDHLTLSIQRKVHIMVHLVSFTALF